MSETVLPTPPHRRPAVIDWVATHLGGLFEGHLEASPRFVGGQLAADEALSSFDVTGYASRRNEVWPPHRRGASALSPYIRHGLLPLPVVWRWVEGGPTRDVSKFRDELLWQEYARHLYARLGRATASPLRHEIVDLPDSTDPWPKEMACVELAIEELERDGWMVNQTRMWMASQWAVRHRADWRVGEDYFFSHLLDGSRAANRLGWQWTGGLQTGKQYGFSRYQVEKRAPGVCQGCRLSELCPIEEWPPTSGVRRIEPDTRLRSDPDVTATAGPSVVESAASPDAVWVTAESLGNGDPALSAWSGLPVVFVFDLALLRRLRLSAKRLVFLAECLADLAQRRAVEVHLGDPTDVIAGRQVAVTFTPVPGWRRKASEIPLAEVHPWPWLRQPHAGTISSFSSWRRHAGG